MTTFNIALAQINATVGDLKGNSERILDYTQTAVRRGAHMVVFPELCLSGYPPEDLLLKQHFLDDCKTATERLAEALPNDTFVLFGAPDPVPGQLPANAAMLAYQGRIHAVYHKMMLPNYSVFDEKRVFSAGNRPLVLQIDNLRLAIHICEDSWITDGAACTALANQQVNAILNCSASPYHRGKRDVRIQTLGRTAQTLNTPLLYCNLIGGQDELVFDGASMVFNTTGQLEARAKTFEEDLLITALPIPENTCQVEDTSCTVDCAWTPSEKPAEPSGMAPLPSELEEVYNALVCGLHDYIHKNGFKHTVVALSGGIDSALVLALAVDALGPDAVTCVTMPSQYSSKETRGDAEAMAAGLGVKLHTIPIKGLFDSYLEELSPLWPDRPVDITEENLQARIRGNIIMAMSNKFGWIVLTTGNKSEMATGYCTLYGDMAGGFAVIKDVPKTLVFELSRWRNQQGDKPVIPPSIISRPPSAELRPDQKDTDSLPPYEVLDDILERYVELDQGVDAITAAGHDVDTVVRVLSLVDRSEYKRRQGPPGIKITPKAFGRDRRVPITNRYRNHA